MPDPAPVLVKALSLSLAGTEAHVETLSALDDLPWRLAGERPAGAPHTIFQILNHMDYWQVKCLEWLRGGDARWPKHAREGWPGGEAPTSDEEWDRLRMRFREGLQEALSHAGRSDVLEPRGKWAPVQMLRSIASHNSYHLGQIVLLRRMLEAWPPPGGGDTW